jgi:hypothetical protein
MTRFDDWCFDVAIHAFAFAGLLYLLGGVCGC